VVHAPPQYGGAEPVPVVLGFHGLGMTGATFAGFSGLTSVADEHGFLLVMLDGAGAPPRWNTRSDAAQPDDVRFVEAVLSDIEDGYCLDADRIYAVGYSNGGGMALATACALPQRIAAIGVTAATYLPCRANVPMIAFHGVNDAIVPFEGGQTPPELGAQTYPSVRRAVSEWAREAGCDPIATISREIAEVELSTFRRCYRGDGEVLLYAVVEGGHTWPGMPVRFEQLGYTTMQISASQLMWEFFEARSTGAP
jgi:polyhydroxybutyrate depolymerase